MARSKESKGGDGVTQKHLHSRISYLHQAASYLDSVSPETGSKTRSKRRGDQARTQATHNQFNQSNHLINQLHGVSKKSQIRLSKDLKRSVCKRCDTLLIPGRTSHEELRNDSKGGSKPWADMFEIRCLTCRAVKRFAVGQQFLPQRKQSAQQDT